MARPFYLTANVTTRDSFSQWLSKHNQITYDMGTVVLTSGSVPQPNTTNGAYTAGNTHLQGIFSATNLVATGNLRGGTTSLSANLNIVSNTIFTNSQIVTIGSNTRNFNLNSNNSYITSNVVATGADKSFTINNLRTQISGGGLYVDCNASFTGSTFTSTSNTFIDSANVVIEAETMTIGANGVQSLDVNSVSNFDANTVINGALSTINANLVHNGSTAAFNNNVQLGSANNDIVTLRSKVLGDILPSANNTYDVGSPTMQMAQSHTYNSFVYNDEIIKRDAYINRDVSIDRSIIQNSTGSSKHVLNGSGGFTTLVYEFVNGANALNPLTVTSNSVLPGGVDKAVNLGSSALRWASAFAHDINTANTIYSGGHSNFATTSVRDIPNRRILVANTSGRLSSFADLSYYGDTIYSPNAVLSANVTSNNSHSLTKSTVGTNVTLNSVGVSTFANNVNLRYFTTTGPITDTSTVSTAFEVVGATTHRSNVTLPTAGTRITAPNATISNKTSTKTLTVSGNADITGSLTAGNTSIKNTTITGTLNVSAKATLGSIASSGSITSVGAISTDATVNSSNTTTGSIVGLGGLGIARDAYIGGKLAVGGLTTIEGDLYVSGQTYLSSNAQLSLASSTAEDFTVTGNINFLDSDITGAMIPSSNNSQNIGSTSKIWSNVYAETFNGSLSGNATTSTRLQTARKINDATFNGTSNVTITKMPVNDVSNANWNMPLMIVYNGIAAISGGSQQSMGYSSGIYVNPSLGQMYADNFNITSDKKLKENIARVDRALDTIDKLQGVSFTRLSSGKKEFGVIAQEVQDVIPEAVSESNDVLTVDTNQFNAFFIEAIKELKEELNKIKEEIHANSI